MGSPINTSHVFQGGATVKGIPASQETGQAVEHDQLIAALNLKQDNMTGGSCIEIDGTTINFMIGSTGTDHSELILTGSGFGSLNGTYSLMDYNGSFQQISSAQCFDLVVGGSDNIYAKEVNPSTWAVIGKRASYWWAALTNTDPNSVTQTVDNFIVNYLSVDNFLITQASEQDSEGDNSPASSSDRIDYAVGGNPGGIIVQNGKAVLDFAASIAAGASSNVYSAEMIKQYIDEQDDFYKLTHNQVFNNSVAQLNGQPSNPQAAIEALKVLADSISSTVSNNQTQAATEYGNIDNLQTALGSSFDDMGEMHSTLSDGTTAKALINELAVLISSLRSDATATLGLAAGGVINSAGENVTDATDVATAISDLDVALGLVQGDLTSRIPAVDQYHNANQYPLTADQLAGIEPVNEVKYDQVDIQSGQTITWSTDMSSFPMDVRILVDFGSAGDVDAGIYDRDHTTGLLTRSTYFNEASEIQKNAIFQIRYGGAIAGAEFMVVTPDEPSIGTDPIGFENISAVIIGQGTLAKDRLRPEFQAEIDNKLVPYESAVVTVPANGALTLVHGHKLFSAPMILDSAGNMQSFELDITVDGTMVITSEADVDIPVTVRFAGLEL